MGDAVTLIRIEVSIKISDAYMNPLAASCHEETRPLGPHTPLSDFENGIDSIVFRAKEGIRSASLLVGLLDRKYQAQARDEIQVIEP